MKNEHLAHDSVTAILANPNISGYSPATLGRMLRTHNPERRPWTTDRDQVDVGRLLTVTTKGNTKPDIQSGEEVHDGVASNVTKLTGATITIDNNTSKDDTPGVMVHESMHAGEAMQNPASAKAERD